MVDLSKWSMSELKSFLNPLFNLHAPKGWVLHVDGALYASRPGHVPRVLLERDETKGRKLSEVSVLFTGRVRQLEG